MTCDRCGQDFDGARCSCGFVPKTYKSEWVTFQCAAPGCTNMIRERIDNHGSKICKWCHAKGLDDFCAEPFRSRSTGVLITKDEFGQDLYRVIALFSERELIREWQRLDVHRGERGRLDWYKTRDKELTDDIAALFGELDVDDQQRLLDRFEPVRVQA